MNSVKLLQNERKSQNYGYECRMELKMCRSVRKRDLTLVAPMIY